MLWTDRSLTQAAGMFEAAMPTVSRADMDLDAMIATSVARQEEIRRIQAEAALVAEACRLTGEWANGFCLNRHYPPTAEDYAAVAIGYYKELKTVGYSTPGAVVGKCRICGGLLAELKGVTSCDSCGREVPR